MRAAAQKVMRRHLLQQPVPARKAAAADTRPALSSGQQLAELGPDVVQHARLGLGRGVDAVGLEPLDRKSTRLNSSHSQISYAVFCLKKKKKPSRIVTWRTDVTV